MPSLQKEQCAFFSYDTTIQLDKSSIAEDLSQYFKRYIIQKIEKKTNK